MIRAKEVRLIGPEGEAFDIVPLNKAKEIAREAGLDLVEIAPQAKPPVCKVMDYGKFKYDKLKRQKEARKKQKTIVVKEVKFRIKIEEHDFQVKAKNAKKFLLAGNKLKVTIMFRGRERSHPEMGREICLKLAKQMDAFSTIEKMPKAEGRNMIMILNPLPEKELESYLKSQEKVDQKVEIEAETEATIEAETEAIPKIEE
ncbi:translation initiation factor IF-3 [Clostridia bacterium]|nr:translation initiation factor IF-3 [Clostridia bacterium]